MHDDSVYSLFTNSEQSTNNNKFPENMKQTYSIMKLSLFFRSDEFESVIAKLICSVELQIALQVFRDVENLRNLDFVGQKIELVLHSPIRSMSVLSPATDSQPFRIIRKWLINSPKIYDVPVAHVTELDNSHDIII